MVLYLDSLEGVLRDHLVLLEIIERACEKWGMGSPIGEKQKGITAENLQAVRGLLKGGQDEIQVG